MHANGPFEGAEQAGRMTGMGAKSAPPIGAERPVQDGPIGGRGTEMGRHEEQFPPLSTASGWGGNCRSASDCLTIIVASL